MKPRRKSFSKRLGSALVMTLVIIVLITVVTVGYLASVMLETKSAGSTLDQEKAYGIAMVGAHRAMARIREALGPWDDPYRNFATNPPTFCWSLSPGRITRWEYSSTNLNTSTNATNFGLFSESAGTSLVDLNRRLLDGTYPIIGGATATNLSVKWANLLRDPSQVASSNNAIVGRYAFWVDDEGAKINVNTADGTQKYMTNSLGIGTPSEVSLQVVEPALTNAQSIAQMARTNGFRSPREILRVPGVATNLFTDNVFSLTAYSRSPELNVFGQPRVSVAPMLGDANWEAGDMLLNSLTLLPAREIYPTPSQLPAYMIASPYDGQPNAVRPNPWPLSLRGETGVHSTGKNVDHRTILRYGPEVSPNYSHNQGFLLANYLSGTNANGQAVTWPVFRGSSAQGFAGKYTPRQLDSIVAQILSIGSKGISSDFPYVSAGELNDLGEQVGHRFMVAPYVFPGWLSRQWVIGIGRGPKVTQAYMRIGTFPSVGTWDPSNPSLYTPPSASMDIWLEWWLPHGYFGGREVIPLAASRFWLGHRRAESVLNVIDFPRSTSGEDTYTLNPFAAPLPRVPDTNSPAIYSFWAKELLRNNQGIDFAGNPGETPNPDVRDNDQDLARNFHDPFRRIDPNIDRNDPNAIGNYKGDSSLDFRHHYASPFFLTELEPNESPTQEWQPGEMRSIRSRLGFSYQMSMQTNATALNITGGIAVKTQMRHHMIMMEPDPVPLEAVRGAYIWDGICTQEPFTHDVWDPGMNAAWVNVLADPNDPAKGNLQERVRVSVIPVNVDVPGLGQERHVAITLRGPRTDPLVNKFPGDWTNNVSATPNTTIQGGDPNVPNPYQDTTFRTTLLDPDSYWMPQADAGLCRLSGNLTSMNDVAVQTQMPRSARMPNVGYLQYVRTGIIPDDEETVPYSSQHGTPFRLLSYAPSYELSTSDPLVGQKTTRPGSHPRGESQPYPDWAMLDLFYIPSTLAAYGSTYNPASPNPNDSAATNLLYYGTFGGATAGKINPNGMVIYTTNADVPQANVSRRLPLQAVLDGVRVNQTITGSGTSVRFTNGTTVSATNIAEAIESYIRTNQPLRMPAEICNVPDIADLRATNINNTGVGNPTRNDLVRQVVGALTTQGNVFSVWTVGQAVQKKPGNPIFGDFEPGDNVLAEVRLRLIVERYLDPGADGVYGNSTVPGPDGVAGTYDDPADANHPFQPGYKYRVIASEEIR